MTNIIILYLLDFERLTLQYVYRILEPIFKNLQKRSHKNLVAHKPPIFFGFMIIMIVIGYAKQK